MKRDPITPVPLKKSTMKQHSWTSDIHRLIPIMRHPPGKDSTRLAAGNGLDVLSAAHSPNQESRSPEKIQQLLNLTHCQTYDATICPRKQ